MKVNIFITFTEKNKRHTSHCRTWCFSFPPAYYTHGVVRHCSKENVHEYVFVMCSLPVAVKGKHTSVDGDKDVLPYYRETAIKHIWHRIAFIAFVSQTFFLSFLFFLLHCVGCCSGSSKGHICCFLLLLGGTFFVHPVPSLFIFFNTRHAAARAASWIRFEFLCTPGRPQYVWNLCARLKGKWTQGHISLSKRFNKKVTNKNLFFFTLLAPHVGIGSILDDSHYKGAHAIHFWHYNVCSL